MENNLFIDGLRLFGKNTIQISNYVGSKTKEQCSSKAKLLLASLIKSPNPGLEDIKEMLIGPEFK